MTGGAVLFLEFFDDTVRWRDKGVDEVEGLPVLGVLGSPSRRDPVVTRYRPRSQQAEAVRQLRARIALTRSPHSLRVVLITSPRAKDGKSTTAANLGVASALGGRRTLLIDADMRNPSLNELFDIPNVLGLADLLTADREDRDRLLDKAIRETSTPNLFVLTAGLTLRDSASLLGSASTGDLFVTLRNRFDYVVVDTPPLLVVPDAAILAPLVEGVVFILRVGRVTRRMVRKMKELLLAAGNVSILGVALTGAPSRVEGKSSTYYRYRSAPATEEFPGLGGRIYKALKFLHRLPVGYTWKLKDGTILVPIAQVARRLGVRTSTAVKWCQAGRLKGARKLFRWWVSEQELHDFVKRELGEEAAAGESAAAGAFSPEDAAALEAADGKAPAEGAAFHRTG
ncbi:MAG: polysaccharide biosynthesis tyrosine autokinase [Anaerolineae bacterium]|nr:polysaccharide biosynthesis tyrosine autokinase [Anaerolineae bacterium]